MSNVKLSAARRQRSKTGNGADAEPHLSLMENVNYDLLPNHIGFWIRRAQLAVMKSYEEHVGDLDLRPVEAAAILLIGQNKDISQIVLGSALGTDQSTMVAICTRLENRGYIERRRLPEDRRYQLLTLTAEGSRAAVAVRKRLIAHNENVLRRIPAAERKKLLAMIQNLVQE